MFISNSIIESLKTPLQDFKSYNDERKQFCSLLNLHKENPWGYVNYILIIKRCLQDIKEILNLLKIEHSYIQLSEDLLSRAHIMQTNPKGVLRGRVFQYRRDTIESGSELCRVFETLCRKLTSCAMRSKISPQSFKIDENAIQTVNTFVRTWENFETKYNQDQLDAEKYFSLFK